MAISHPSIERLHELFRLDAADGSLWWKTSTRGHRANTRAGSLQADGYYRVYVDGSKLPVHRVVWAMCNGRWPSAGCVVDHINGDPGDNRPSNLREVTWKANSQNRQCSDANNRSGSKVPGVCIVRGRFYVNLRIDGRVKFLGSHGNLEDAERAAIELRRQHYHGNTL